MMTQLRWKHLAALAGTGFVLLALTTSVRADAYDTLRVKWANYIIGSTNATALANYAKDATVQWTNMNASFSMASGIWSDYPFTGDYSSVLWQTYARLRTMAIAWAAPGSSLEGNAALRDDIIRALDWLYANVYKASGSQVGDWYPWEIRAPQNLNDTMVLMYSALSAGKISNYISAIDYFSPGGGGDQHGWMTGANLSDKCGVAALRGIVGKTSGKLDAAQTHMSDVYPFVTSGDGFYRDGSYVFHGEIAYSGAYGNKSLNVVSGLINLLKGSTWDITADANYVNTLSWVSNSFMPLLYGGAMMDMVRGRTIANSSYQPDSAEGDDCKTFMLQVAQYAPAATATYFSNFATAKYPKLPPGQFHFAKMDRVVALRSGFGVGLSMCSSRIANYESINGDNLHGWYTGDGMLYMYLGDVDRQYAGDWWCTANMLHLPGTTVVQGGRGDAAGQDTKSGQNWVGGAQVADTYGAAGMSLNAEGYNLTGKKSWFMFDKEVVCLGAGITSSSAPDVHTTVEHRRLGTLPNNNLWVSDGGVYLPIMGWSGGLSGLTWCALDGVGGYYFPGGADVTAKFEARSGQWSDIGNNTSTNVLTDDYFTLYFNHGAGPSGATYSYVLLPNMDATATADYAGNPGIVVLNNGTSYQAVSKPSAGIVAANFWTGNHTADIITCDSPASVITWNKGSAFSVGIADPTQNNSGSIVVTLNWTAPHIKLVSKDSRITVSRLTPTIQLTVDVNGSGGKSLQAVFANELTWDASTGTGGVQDGSGTWNNSLQDWSDGSANYAWNDAAPANAVFGAGGTAGTVTVSGTHTAGQLTFNTTGSGSYTLSGAESLTLNNGIAANASATVNTPVTVAADQALSVASARGLAV